MTTPQTVNNKDEPAAPSQWFHRRESVIPLVLILFAVAFNLYHLYPEVAGGVLDGNDMALHRLLTEAAWRPSPKDRTSLTRGRAA